MRCTPQVLAGLYAAAAALGLSNEAFLTTFNKSVPTALGLLGETCVAFIVKCGISMLAWGWYASHTTEAAQCGAPQLCSRGRPACAVRAVAANGCTIAPGKQAPFAQHPSPSALRINPLSSRVPLPPSLRSHPLHRPPHRRRRARCAQRHAAPRHAALHLPRGRRLRGGAGHLRLRSATVMGPAAVHCWLFALQMLPSSTISLRGGGPTISAACPLYNTLPV